MDNNILNEMRIAKEARFSAYRRLTHRSKISLTQISILTLAIVCVSIAQLAYAKGLDETKNLILTIFTIIASLLVLIVSLLEANNSFELRGFRLRQSGQSISNILVRLDTGSIDENEAISMFEKVIAENDALPDKIDEINAKIKSIELRTYGKLNLTFIAIRYVSMIVRNFVIAFFPAIAIIVGLGLITLYLSHSPFVGG